MFFCNESLFDLNERACLIHIKLFSSEQEIDAMRKFLFTNAILGVSALGFIACAPAASNTNRTVLNTKTNTAVTNSNISSSVNSNTSSNMSPKVGNNVSSSDGEFVDKALQGGLEEVQMGGIAAVKAQNVEVTAFAQTMINDHSKANNELRDLAKQKGISVTGGTTAEQQKEMNELSNLPAAEFDKAYVKKMVAAHEKDVAEFQKQANSATDANVKRFAEDTLPILKTHLEMIKAIQGKIK
jgi:putative membrane protein